MELRDISQDSELEEMASTPLFSSKQDLVSVSVLLLLDMLSMSLEQETSPEYALRQERHSDESSPLMPLETLYGH